MAIYPELKGKTAIVTGAASLGSIGEAIALAFGRQGTHVAVVDIDEEGAQRVAGQIRRDGGEAFAVRADVTRSDEVEAMVREVLQREGKVDILVNNAGGFHEVELANQISDERWDFIIDLNLKSVFLCSRAVYDHMVERRWGRIINISSVAGRMPTLPTPVHYAAAKAGVIALTKYLARELAPYGVTVNAVAPGTTKTARFLRLRGADAEEKLRGHVPLGRLSTPQDQAAAVLFLASDEASYITGATLDVNGGTVML
jgi:NAD(P)-dependent dehydrogenase (short-subunit alcohol dehydrogenase family)